MLLLRNFFEYEKFTRGYHKGVGNLGALPRHCRDAVLKVSPGNLDHHSTESKY